MERKSLKKPGLQLDWNSWPSRIPVRCSTNWTMKLHFAIGREVNLLISCLRSREEWNDLNYMWDNSYLNCGCRWKWRMIIAVNFPIWAKNKPEKKLVSKLGILGIVRNFQKVKPDYIVSSVLLLLKVHLIGFLQSSCCFLFLD